MNKHLRLASLVAGAAILAAACTSPGATTAPSTAPGSTAPSTAPASSAPASVAPASVAPTALKGELTIWHTYGSGAGTELKALQEVLAEVKTESPELTVNVLEIPFGDVFNKYNADAATGAGPDLFIAPNDSLGFQAREMVISDLDSLLADKLGDTVTTSKAWAHLLGDP